LAKKSPHPATHCLPHIVSRPPCLTKHSNKTATVSETVKLFLADKMDIIYKYTNEED
jgi:hypothetical protein